MIKCSALRFKSGNVMCYLGLIKAKELISESKTDAYDAVINQDGYQRKIQKSRSKRFADYLLKCDGGFNGTVLLNIRASKICNFTQRDTELLGTLEISGNVYVVDGQHRIEGLKIAIEQGYSGSSLVPAIITVGNNKNEEALSFLIVNRTAKGIKADLTDELIYKTISPRLLTDNLKLALNLSVQQSIGEFSLDVTKGVNDCKNSIWYKRIAMPEQSVSGNRIVRQRSFAMAVVEAIKSCGTLKRAVNIGEIDSVVDWLIMYWQAVAEVCPQATSLSDATNYVLMKSVGVDVMNRLFGRVLDDVGKDPEVSDFAESLRKMESLEDSSWKSSTGTYAKLGTNKAAIDKIYNALELEFDTSSVI